MSPRACAARHVAPQPDADIAGNVVPDELGAADMLPKPRLIRKALPFRPHGLQLLCCPDGTPFRIGDDAEEIGDAHDLDDARNMIDRGLVIGNEDRADARGSDDTAVQHAGQLEILHVGETPVHLVWDVNARHRLSDDPIVGRRL
jgi:hypothetical protein